MAGVDIAYVFCGDERDPTWGMLGELCEQAGRSVAWSGIRENLDQADTRRWNPDRYHRMVVLRNRLLDLVRRIDPPAFLSLDSDILLHGDTLKDLIESLASGRFDAVGGRTYMTRGVAFPSWGKYTNNGLLRQDASEGVFEMDVIMAIKLMSPAAYAIDYEYDHRGEDLGICAAWHRAGLHLGVDTRSVSKHVMERFDLEKVDERCGY